MDRFRGLVVAAMLAGSAGGLVLFAVQTVTVVPLIERAEVFEAAAEAHAAAGHADEGWQPAPGLERIGLTAVATMLSGIGFASVLLAAMTLRGDPVNARRGVVWGLAGFACFVLAPSLGFPPKPPGAAVGDLEARELWWLGTAAATSAGLWLICGEPANWWRRASGVVVLLVPHAIGAPRAVGENVVPAVLMRDFVLFSVASNLVFWLVVGALCGWLRDRSRRRGIATA